MYVYIYLYVFFLVELEDFFLNRGVKIIMISDSATLPKGEIFWLKPFRSLI